MFPIGVRRKNLYCTFPRHPRILEALGKQMSVYSCISPQENFCSSKLRSFYLQRAVKLTLGPFRKCVSCIMAFLIPFTCVRFVNFILSPSSVSCTKILNYEMRETNISCIYGCLSICNIKRGRKLHL